MGLAWIPPELREDRGEIEAAAAGRLPHLIRVEDLRGDLHMHSTWSDGRNSIEEMVEACAAQDYEYMVISDHSKSLAMTGGLDAYRLREQWKEIDEVRARHPEIRILRSMEVDILGDGSLDLEDEMLAGLDLVLVSLHSRLDLPAAQQTERVLRALEHPEVNIFCHPTARLINRRKPAEIDVEIVLRRAAELGVAVELNSSPNRLDLKDTHLVLAKELGCKVVIDTDSHRTRELELMRYGVEQARRAGLGAAGRAQHPAVRGVPGGDPAPAGAPNLLSVCRKYSHLPSAPSLVALPERRRSRKNSPFPRSFPFGMPFAVFMRTVRRYCWYESWRAPSPGASCRTGVVTSRRQSQAGRGRAEKQ